MNPATWLLQFRHDEFSQTGEDGVIEKILALLPHTDRWCVEFGAWDGLYMTNTRRLILSQNYSAVMIEANTDKFRQLQHTYAQHADRVITLNAFVGFKDDDSLDSILLQTRMPHDFDLLSIDIDGNDYHVWERVVTYRPKVVVIEFNPTIPTDVHFIQPADPRLNQGASLSALVELGKQKGYELVCVLPWNACFVDRKYYSLFDLASNSPHDLRTDTSFVTHLFTGYDGRVFLQGSCKLPWHDMPMRASRMQVLPRTLQRYPPNLSTFERGLLALVRAWNKSSRILPASRRILSRLGSNPISR